MGSDTHPGAAEGTVTRQRWAPRGAGSAAVSASAKSLNEPMRDRFLTD